MNVLGFLLTKSQELKSPVDIDEALKYPLSPVPLAIAHADGEKRKTNKSALYKFAFNSMPSSQTVEYSDGRNKVYILDLAALLRSTVKVPDTFEDLAMKIYHSVPTTYTTIYVACDTYHTRSIKSPERRLRGEAEKLIIRSEKVKIPPNFQQFLCNGENKERLFELIEKTLIKNRELMIDDRTIYFARGTSCMKITKEGATEMDDLKTDHEEADTKIAHLIQHAINSGTAVGEICVRSSSGDIDIPVILVGLFGTSETVIKVDNGTGKNRKIIRIDSSMLSGTQQKALVGFHAYTGNDCVKFFEKNEENVDIHSGE